MATVQTNKQYTINYRDLLRGLLITVGTAVGTAILDALNAGGLSLDWKQIGLIALTAGISYILKNFLTPTEVVVSNATKDVVNQVKKGAPVQVAGHTVAQKEV